MDEGLVVNAQGEVLGQGHLEGPRGRVSLQAVDGLGCGDTIGQYLVGEDDAEASLGRVGKDGSEGGCGHLLQRARRQLLEKLDSMLDVLGDAGIVVAQAPVGSAGLQKLNKRRQVREGAGVSVVEEDKSSQRGGNLGAGDSAALGEALGMQPDKAREVAGLGFDGLGRQVIGQTQGGEGVTGRLLLCHVDAVASLAQKGAREVAGCFDLREGAAKIVEVVQVVGDVETGLDGTLAHFIDTNVSDEGRPAEPEGEAGVAESAKGGGETKELAR